MCYVCLFGISHLNTTMEHLNTGADPGFSKGGVCVCGGGGGSSDNHAATSYVLFSQEKVWSKYLRLFRFRRFDRITRTTPGSAPVITNITTICRSKYNVTSSGKISS